MSTLSFTCNQCGKTASKPSGGVKRAWRKGAPLYCNMTCASLARRDPLPPSDFERKARKRWYDQAYRDANRDDLKAKKRAYHLATYDPAAAAVKRKKRMPAHVEYCRQPAYREQKQAYDRVYRAKREAGEFWESLLLTLDLRSACLERMTDYEIRLQNGTLGKSQQRKRDFRRLVGDRA